MAERSTAAVDVAETSGENGDPLTARQDGATSDGATDATNGHSRAAKAPQETLADPTDPSDPSDPIAEADADSAEGVTDPVGESASRGGEQPERPSAEAKAEARAEAKEEAAVKTEAEADAPTDRAGKSESPAKNGRKQTKTPDAAPHTAPGAASGTAASPARTSRAPKEKAPEDGASQEGTPEEREREQPQASEQDEAPKQLEATEGPEKPEELEELEEEAPELHSGHKLARRYRLEECVTRLDGFSSWRAVDEKLRRAVGVHVLPAGHPRARQVLAAARSAALLGDPRFVQVLDAVEEDDLVYVVHEWLPDATPLNELLTAGPWSRTRHTSSSASSPRRSPPHTAKGWPICG